MMTDEQFDELWQRAESKQYSDALMRDYPAWKHHRKVRQRVAGGVMCMALVVGVGLNMFAHRSNDNYEQVYCNRTDISDAAWVELASDLLLMS